jgi:hypothetical protein
MKKGLAKNRKSFNLEAVSWTRNVALYFGFGSL